MSKPGPSLEEIFAAQIANLALTLRPGSLSRYHSSVRNFLRYLRANYPDIQTLSELRREPHILGWLRSLCERQPPLFALSTTSKNEHTLAG